MDNAYFLVYEQVHGCVFSSEHDQKKNYPKERI